jgi:hypothetical protein
MMPIASMRRRVGKLETEGPFRLIREYPRPTSSEIVAFAHRLKTGERLSIEEAERLEQHSPILQGELLICGHRGHVTVKRYVGLDVAEI